MKRIAILLLALLISGCGSGRPTAQSASGGLWQAQLSGGEGSASGFSFNTQFTVNSDDSLSISNFEFLNSNSCFPINGGTISGSMPGLTQNMANNTVNGTIMFTVTSGGNTLTLEPTGSSVTGTIVGTTLSDGKAMGNWSLAGSGGACPNATGSFSMTQTSS
jgi:hypothetical protein